MKNTKRILSVLLCLVMILGIIPVIASAEGETYTKVTSKDEITSGQYVMVIAAGYAVGAYDGSWLGAKKITITDDTIAAADAAGYVYTLTIDGTSAKLQDSNGKYVAPKSGNTNGIQNKEYAWNLVIADDCTVQFKGTGSDTTTLASNKGSSYKFRAYKNTTATNETNYPTKFTLYKLDEAEGGDTPDTPACEHLQLSDAIHVDGKHVAQCEGCEEMITSTEYAVSVAYDENGHNEVCTCGYAGEVAAHVMSDWTVKTPATAAAPGEEIKTCSGCAYTLSQEIPQLEATGAHYVKVNGELLSGSYILVAGSYAMGLYNNGWILNTTAPVIDDNTVTDDMGGVWTLTVTDAGVMLTDPNGVTVAPKAGNNNGIQAGDYNWAVTINDDGTYSFAGVGTDTTMLALNTDATNGLNRFRAYKTSTLASDTKGTYISKFALYKLEGEVSCDHETKYTTTATTHIAACSKCEEVFVEESFHDIKGENGTCSICGIEVDEAALTAAILEKVFALATGEKLEGSYSLTGTVTKINYTFDTNYKNMSVTIAIEGYDQTIYCYRMKCTADQAAKIFVGSVITVEGPFENYNGTYELNAGTLISIAACAHTAGDAQQENVVDANCTTAGSYDLVTYCTICGEEMSREPQTIDALGHTYDDDADADCNVCGETREVGPAVDANLNFLAAPGLSFQDYIGMQVLVPNTTADKYDRIWVEAVQADPAGDVTATLYGAPYFGIYQLFEQQILSWSMTENVTLTLYAEKDGKVYVGQTVSASVQKLATDKIASYESQGNTKAVTALVDMLNYGKAVQLAFNHNVENLPTAGDYVGTTSTPDFNAENNKIGTGAVSVLKDSISMQAKVEVQLLFAVDISAYTVKATVGGVDAPYVIDTETMAGYGWTLVRVAIGAAKMRDTYTIALYDAEGNAVTQVYEVSVEAYGAPQLGGTYNDVVIAMMRYGDSVAAI